MCASSGSLDRSDLPLEQSRDDDYQRQRCRRRTSDLEPRVGRCTGRSAASARSDRSGSCRGHGHGPRSDRARYRLDGAGGGPGCSSRKGDNGRGRATCADTRRSINLMQAWKNLSTRDAPALTMTPLLAPAVLTVAPPVLVRVGATYPS